MSSGLLKSACLSVGLASAWAPSAEADILTEIHFQAELTHGVEHARVLLGSLGSGSVENAIFLRDLSLPGMGSGMFASELALSDFGNAFAMIGILAGSGDARVVITAGGGSGLYGITFEEAFPGISESVLIDQLITNDPAADGFLLANFAQLSITRGNFNNAAAFSVGEPVGGIIFDVVSVPAPSALGVLAFALIPRRRRGR